MAIRIDLSASPLGYALALVDGIGRDYKRFGAGLWGEDRTVPLRLKELIFLRCSIVNQCPT